jgi:uncharacterized phosphosugar-binding protein
MEETQENVINSAAKVMADCIQRGGLVHLFGSGHSMLPVLELFPRYGSFVGLHPLMDPRLLWFNVLGSFGVPEMLFLQNTEGYADVFLDGQHLKSGDVLVVFSHGGTSAVVVDAARYAKRLGITVIAVSSLIATTAPAKHSSGQKLCDLADLTIDTGSPRSEALIDVEGLPEPVGAATTLLATAAGLAAVARAAELLAEAGFPVVQSVRAEANETGAYRNVYDAYENSLHSAARQSRDESGAGVSTAIPKAGNDG